MIRWILAGLAFFLLYSLVGTELRRHFSKKKEETSQEQEQGVAAGDMVKDPVCGTYVAVTSGVTVRDGEIVHRFCSYECRDAFLKKLQGTHSIDPPKE